MVRTESHLGRTRVNWETALWHTCGELSSSLCSRPWGQSSYAFSYVFRPV